MKAEKDKDFKLIKDIVDISNDIIHIEYKDEMIVNKGKELFEEMIRLARSAKDEVEGKEKDSLDEEIQVLNGYLKRVEEAIREYDSLDYHAKDEVVGIIEDIATYNLRQYEERLSQTFNQV
ncbi:hypothetical protein [Halonatronum saccharophilum]|uniref:hypothetical protein n=1 Tax=Halonatronum saccharophilum TaxID=150060 RepID=UPI000481032B|nr:hypothetical protein [Halonatronum saccharophilum]